MTAKDLVKKYGAPDQFVATLVDGQGKAYAGQTVEVLLEEVSKGNSEILSGRTDTGILVNLPAPKELLGTYVMVNIVESKSHYLIGELAK